ncbi:MAG: hypothetical protein V4543_18015 [Bacteroidota bacterium]
MRNLISTLSICSLCLLLACTGCASFSPKLTGNNLNKLKPGDPVKFSGNFNRFSNYCIHSNRKAERGLNTDMFYALTDTSVKYDPSLHHSVNAEFKSDSLLTLSFYADSILVRRRNYSGRLKENGFFQFDKTMNEVLGIPILAGQHRNRRVRAGFSNAGHLLIEEANEHYGGFLILIYWGGERHVVYTFKRLTDAAESPAEDNLPAKQDDSD